MSDLVQVRSYDRRVARTRSALRLAFNHLILTKGYETLTAADIAEQANIGRSTFYEHYRGKEHILAESVVPILASLADSCVESDASPELMATVEHFWENRKLARALLVGRARGILAQQLARMIEDRIDAAGIDDRLLLPKSIAAAQLANGQLAIIDAWITGRHGCSAGSIATAVHACSRAVVQALIMEPPNPT